MNAIYAFEASVKQLCPQLRPDAWEYLKSGLQFRGFLPKQFFIEAGALQPTIGFVYKGLLRGFYLDDQGNEITIRFASEGSYATHYTAFITQQPSRYFFQCLEPCELLILSYQHIQQGYQLHESLERYGRLIAEEVLKYQQSRIESFQFYNAEQRYVNFIQANPTLFHRVSLTHLATFLGIERPSLSRIRKKLATK